LDKASPVAERPDDEGSLFAMVPWRHHVEIKYAITPDTSSDGNEKDGI
jgi:hypothetical protein